MLKYLIKKLYIYLIPQSIQEFIKEVMVNWAVKYDKKLNIILSISVISFIFISYYWIIKNELNTQMNIISLPGMELITNYNVINETSYIAKIFGIDNISQKQEFTVMLIIITILALIVILIGKIFSIYILWGFTVFIISQVTNGLYNYVNQSDFIYNRFGIEIKRIWTNENMLEWIKSIIMENHLIEKKLNYSEILNQIKGYNTMNKIEIIEKIIEIINKMLMEIEIKNQKSYLEIIGGWCYNHPIILIGTIITTSVIILGCTGYLTDIKSILTGLRSANHDTNEGLKNVLQAAKLTNENVELLTKDLTKAEQMISNLITLSKNFTLEQKAELGKFIEVYLKDVYGINNVDFIRTFVRNNADIVNRINILSGRLIQAEGALENLHNIVNQG